MLRHPPKAQMPQRSWFFTWLRLPLGVQAKSELQPVDDEAETISDRGRFLPVCLLRALPRPVRRCNTSNTDLPTGLAGLSHRLPEAVFALLRNCDLPRCRVCKIPPFTATPNQTRQLLRRQQGVAQRRAVNSATPLYRANGDLA